ncbi:hypothetical protein [Burkholderia pseudomallei]|uniref:hypothetical protein n=1 Tax=Burkholderia pseudomallei TaxID=28450 RepID=UPI000F25C751|nr:hypothetical protein [Burkholderia pseudomallei]VBQ36332.1 Uncharacterised protein [Burkholderia pseudomallei]
MNAPAESAAIKAMAEQIERLERELASKQSAPNLPSQLGDFARILRSHGIATVFHAGKIDPIDGGTAAESLRAAVEQFGRRERLMPECQARLIREISGSLFDATDGFDAVKKAQVA